MTDMLVLPKLRMSAGARYEDSRQAVDAQSPWAVVDPGTRVEKHFQDFLPAINLTYSPNTMTNVRAAYSRTLNRPELRELSPFSMDNYETGFEETGDTSLVEARLENYDLRWELYPGAKELLALGVFYKQLNHPIVRYAFPNVSGYAERPVNGVELDGKPGNLYGWEGEMRLSLVDVWRGLDWAADLGRAPGFLGDWSLSANYSQVESETHVVNAAHRTVTVPLAGQSDYSANVGLFYGHHFWEGALLYRSFGPRLRAFGFGDLKDIYEYPPKSLDFTLSYRLSERSRLKFAAENLLDEELEFKQGDMITQSYKVGTTFGISVSYSAEGGEN
jgi:outer membrane receptor protein involved in Fe transport